MARSAPGVTPNFTGQYLDDTGLLFYNARYYDPMLGRFISADPLVPNGERGDLADVTHKALTVSFIDSRFLNAYNEENQLPAWHLMSESQRADAKEPWGPANAQVLNRYSYVENNPFGYRDPTGHRRIGPACMCPGGGAGRGMGGRWPQVMRSANGKGTGGGGNQTANIAASSPTKFSHAWIKRDLFQNLQKLVGKADFEKFKAALNKGIVGPQGQSGIKILNEPVNGYTHELKIGGSAQRLLGRIDENGVLVFDKHVPGGLHK